MSHYKYTFVFLQFGCGFLLLHSADVTEKTNIESEGLLSVFGDRNNAYEIEEGSGANTEPETKVNIQIKRLNYPSTDCDCSKSSTTDKTIYLNKPEPVVANTKSIPSSVIVIIVILSILLLVSIVAIAYLLGKVKYLNMRQNVPVSNQCTEDYDSDEYSVMMDWNAPNIVVKPNKKKQKMNGH